MRWSGVVRTSRLSVDGTYGPLVRGGRVGDHVRSPVIVEADCRPTRPVTAQPEIPMHRPLVAALLAAILVITGVLYVLLMEYVG